jgi:catechol 2,3-dioxygenase-like lactoylglutathione lyase family enzyme
MEKGDLAMSQLFKRIDSTFLVVKDFEKMLKWYSETMGFPILFTNEAVGCLKVGNGSALTLVREEVLNGEGHALFNFYTSDIEQAEKVLVEAGCRITRRVGNEHFKAIEYRDPEDNFLSLCWFPEAE